MSSIANHRIYLIVLLKVLGDRERKGKEKYDRMSGCGKRDFNIKKLKREKVKMNEF